MCDKQEIQDPLKPLNQIYEPDERQKHFFGTLADRHETLNKIVLNDNVPLEVRQLFETAKNLCLYSWFVYRFHQVAELISFSALEMALRVRYLAENPIERESKQRPPALYQLMQYAKRERWITNEGFLGLYELARHHAEHNKMVEKLKTHDFEKQPDMPIDEPTEDEIQEVLDRLDRVTAIADNAHKIRNDLAHGSSTLHPNSISTLRTNAEVINQIYS